MTNFEKAEIRRLPKKYRPMGAWSYFWHTILYIIPVIGWICFIWGACSDKRICRRSYARFFCCAFVIFVLGIAALVVLKLLGMVDEGLFTPVDDILRKINNFVYDLLF